MIFLARMTWVLLSFNETADQTEKGLVAVEPDGTHVVGGSMVVRECAAFLVFEEDAGNTADGEE